MSSTTNSSKVDGSTFIVTLSDLDKDDSFVSFALTKNDEQFCFLNTVSSSLERHTRPKQCHRQSSYRYKQKTQLKEMQSY